MNTATLHRTNRAPLWKSSNTVPIKEGTQNVSANFIDAICVVVQSTANRMGLRLGEFLRVSALRQSAEVFPAMTKTAIALQLRRATDSERGYLERILASLRNFAQSIFTPSLTPADKEPAFAADIEQLKAEVNRPENQTPGARVNADVVGEFDGGKFIPKAGVVYPPEIKAQFPEIFGKGEK